LYPHDPDGNGGLAETDTPGVDVTIGENALKQKKKEQKNVNTIQPYIEEIPTGDSDYLV